MTAPTTIVAVAEAALTLLAISGRCCGCWNGRACCLLVGTDATKNAIAATMAAGSTGRRQDAFPGGMMTIVAKGKLFLSFWMLAYTHPHTHSTTLFSSFENDVSPHPHPPLCPMPKHLIPVLYFIRCIPTPMLTPTPMPTPAPTPHAHTYAYTHIMDTHKDIHITPTPCPPPPLLSSTAAAAAACSQPVLLYHKKGTSHL